ncbi:MAG: V4R domain-containing protein [Anaerolineae bacterium]
MSEDQVRQPAGFPNKISRILLLSLEDVVGSRGSSAILTTAKLAHLIDNYPPADFEPGLTFAEVGRLFEAVEGLHGVTGGRQLARRAGRESFRYWIEGLGSIMGFADVALRLLPLSFRVRIGIEVLAEIFNRYSDQVVRLGEGSEGYYIVLERCGFCEGRRTETPACAFPVGIIEESLFWVSRGRQFSVEETTCVACGDSACTFHIAKKPLS